MLKIFKLIKGIAEEHSMSHKDISNLLQQAIEEAIISDYPSTTKIEVIVDIDQEMLSANVRKKVSSNSSNGYYIPIDKALEYKSDIEIGDWIWIPINLKELGRISSSIVKKTISREFENQDSQKIYEEFNGKKGKIVAGVVLTENSHGEILIDLKAATGIMPKREQIPHETIVAGDVVKAYVIGVERRRSRIKVFLSRSHPGMLKKLMEINIPELRSGAIEIKAIARDLGQRAKVAVSSNRPNIDPVGVCVGIKGIRIDAIVNELDGERIDVIKWSPDIAQFIANSAKPAKIDQIDIDEEDKDATLFADRDNIALAIGKKGQNVRLISKLTGYKISIERVEDMKVEPSEETEAENV